MRRIRIGRQRVTTKYKRVCVSSVIDHEPRPRTQQGPPIRFAGKLSRIVC